jgi:hypothetical protein
LKREEWFMADNYFDVIIIGSGAGGGTVGRLDEFV